MEDISWDIEEECEVRSLSFSCSTALGVTRGGGG
jgi:hypothetical protein